MATRYWRGGSGTWNTSSTTNWSTTSGGAGGASAPTIADTVIIDNNSGSGTITVSGAVSCAAFYWGNGTASNITTITSGTSITVAGTCIIDQNSSSYFFTVGSLILTGTGNFASAIPNFSSNFTAPITINGSGITVTVTGGGFNSTTGALTLTQGTLALGSSSISAASFSSSNTNTRGINWGTGSIGVGSGSGTLWNTSTSTNFTSTGTSNITVGGSGTFSITPGSLALNYTINGAVGSTIALAGLTVNNLTLNTSGSATNASGTFTVNGNLSLTGSGTFGGVGNLTVGGTLTATGSGTFANSGTNNIAGSAATVLSFPSTYTFNSTYSFNLTYSGSTGTRTVSLPYNSTVANIPSLNVPLGSDTVSFGSSTTNYLTNLSFSGFTGTASGSAALVLYGNLTLGSSTTFSLSGGISLSGSGTQTLTTNGRTISTSVTQNGSGTVSLSGNMTMSGAFPNLVTYTLSSGFLSLGTNTLSTNLFVTTGSSSRTIQFATGNITLTGGASATIWSGSTTNFLYTGTSTINVNPSTNSSYTVSTGTLTESQSMNFVFGSGTYSISDSNSVYKNIDATNSSGSITGTSRTVYGNIVTGASVSAFFGTTTLASTSTPQTITSNAVSFGDLVQNNGTGISVTLNDNLTATSYILTAGALALNNRTLSVGSFTSNNSNTRSIQFSTSGNITTTGGLGFSMSTNTNFSYSGTSAININTGVGGSTVNTGSPSSAQALSFNFSGSGTVAEIGAPIYNNVNHTSFSGTWPNNARSLYGNLTLSSSATYTPGSNATSFINTSTIQVITSNGATLNNPINQGIAFGASASIQLADNLTLGSSYAYNLYGGALDLNNKTLSTGVFFSNSVNTRSIAFGTTGNITTTGTTGTVWDISTATGFSYTGASNALINMNGVTISPGAQSSSTAVNFHFQGISNVTINAGAVKDLDFSLVSTGSLYNSSGTVTMYGDLTFSPTMLFAGGPSIIAFAATSGTQKITTYNNPYFVSYTQYQQTGSGGTVQLQDNLVGYTYSLLAGTFDANNYNVTLGAFTSTTTTNTRSILMGSGTWTIGNGSTTQCQWGVASTNLSLTKGTSNIVMSPLIGQAVTFDGGDFTYNNITLNLLGSSTATFSGNNTFATFTCSPTTAGNNLTFTSGSTTTVTGWAVNGSAGNLLGLNATTSGSQATLSKTSGTVTSYFLNLQDSNATGGATWIASNSVNLGNNTGWYLPNGNNNIFLLFS